MLVEKKKNIIFCEVPKAGSKNWNKVLSSDSLDELERLDKSMHLESYEMKENNEMFRELRKGYSWNYRILNTRHPLARLHSVWKDIFTNNDTIKEYSSFEARILPYENKLSLSNKKTFISKSQFSSFFRMASQRRVEH